MKDILIEQGEDTLKRFIESLAKPLKTLNTEFSTFANELIYLSKITASKIDLERLLNDKFDPIYRRIYITNNQLKDIYYLWNASEGIPTYIYNKSENIPYLMQNKADNLRQYDFKINLPVGIVYDTDLLDAYMNKFKLPDKKYILNFPYSILRYNISGNLYVYNDEVYNTEYNFNRFTGIKTKIEPDVVFVDPEEPDKWMLLIITNVYDVDDSLIQSRTNSQKTVTEPCQYFWNAVSSYI